MDEPSYLDFDKTKYAWKPDVDYREHPELYLAGKGEQGVLICEPYKGELVPLWRFKTPDIARESSQAIYKRFLAYLREGDFVGADMARKFLQMGFTRSRWYTNYKGGRKYDAIDKHQLERDTGDPANAESSRIFFDAWKKAEARPAHAKMKAEWKEKYG
ncbi:DUF4385 domain-containing protein [Tautonia plasticadhaerens]|uniref:DUF4385 domain-containing protein n=1 Tax=Tautonia plasticadhaerens TaxID=2527974 RepID=A0A518H671_9BACT|nr:DUF4385 domain-containing protein [Tautonia plasticadhaerens]QDV36330.1 hypothetical protein ElP_42500 [Tautonia plasticadhaerens]